MSYSLPHVKITVVQGRNLVAKDANNMSDPYCKLHIEDANGERLGNELTSSVIEKNRNPKWEEEFADWKFTREQVRKVKGTATVVIDVWDKDRFTADDFMGRCSFPLSDIEEGKPKLMWLELGVRPDKKDVVEGELRVIAYWVPLDDSVADAAATISGI